MEALLERKAEAAARLADARRAAGRALLDDRKPKFDAIASAELELTAITEAESELVDRQRQEAATEEAARLMRLRTALAEAEGARLDAIEKANNAAKQLAASLSEALEQGRAVCSALSHLGRAPPSVQEFEKRLSGHLSAVLGTISHPGRFGWLDLHLLPNTMSVAEGADRSWRTSEASAWSINNVFKIEGNDR